jgi:hypothetical protein
VLEIYGSILPACLAWRSLLLDTVCQKMITDYRLSLVDASGLIPLYFNTRGPFRSQRIELA